MKAIVPDDCVDFAAFVLSRHNHSSVQYPMGPCPDDGTHTPLQQGVEGVWVIQDNQFVWAVQPESAKAPS